MICYYYLFSMCVSITGFFSHMDFEPLVLVHILFVALKYKRLLKTKCEMYCIVLYCMTNDIHICTHTHIHKHALCTKFKARVFRLFPCGKSFAVRSVITQSVQLRYFFFLFVCERLVYVWICFLFYITKFILISYNEAEHSPHVT